MKKIIEFITRKEKDKDYGYYLLTEAPASEKKKFFMKAMRSADEDQSKTIAKYEELVRKGQIRAIGSEQPA